MASGGGFRRSFSNACDFIYDFNCSKCADKCSKYVEASYYCQQCDTFFCKPCLVQFACDHNLLGRADVDKWEHSVRVRREEKCPKHKGNNIEVYCSKHDVVCCRACVLTSHKMCGPMQNISKITKEKYKSSNLKKAQNELKDLQTKTNQLQKDRASRLADLDKHHTQLIDDLKEFRSKLNDILDDLEKQTLQEIDKMRVDFADRFKAEQQLCSNITAESEEFQKKLSKIDNNDETLAFVRFNLCDNWIKEQTQLIADISVSIMGVQPKLVFNTKMEETLKKMCGLGEIVTDSSARKIPLEQIKPRVNIKQIKPRVNIKVNQPYIARMKTTVNVKFDDDDDVCAVTGMCQLANGIIIMSDNNNRNLKKIDNTYKKACAYRLPAWPTSVCTTKESEVAVALAGNAIQFITVRDHMSTRHSFTTKHSYHSLSSNGNKLYALQHGMSDVFEYNLSGSLLRTISTSQRLVGTRSVEVSPDGKNLYIADSQRGLATLDYNGKLLTLFKPEDLNSAESVCVDGLGQVFVCDCSPRNVLLVSQTGIQQLSKISFEAGSVVALCFDKLNMKLLVATNRCNFVHVVHLDKI